MGTRDCDGTDGVSEPLQKLQECCTRVARKAARSARTRRTVTQKVNRAARVGLGLTSFRNLFSNLHETKGQSTRAIPTYLNPRSRPHTRCTTASVLHTARVRYTESRKRCTSRAGELAKMWLAHTTHALRRVLRWGRQLHRRKRWAKHHRRRRWAAVRGPGDVESRETACDCAVRVRRVQRVRWLVGDDDFFYARW